MTTVVLTVVFTSFFLPKIGAENAPIGWDTEKPYKFRRVLTAGSKGLDVTAWQNNLEKKKFLVMPAKGRKGRFEKLTTNATAKFQKIVGLKPTGRLDSATLAYLSAYEPPPDPILARMGNEKDFQPPPPHPEVIKSVWDFDPTVDDRTQPFVPEKYALCLNASYKLSSPDRRKDPSFAEVVTLMRVINKIPYLDLRRWIPNISERTKLCDRANDKSVRHKCLAKTYLLHEKVVTAQLVVGDHISVKEYLMSKRTFFIDHVWLRWYKDGRWWVLDCSLCDAPILEAKVLNEYVPYYVADRRGIAMVDIVRGTFYPANYQAEKLLTATH